MKRYFLIFLLLISFNVNAIAGSVMMLDMAAMASSTMMKESTASHEHMPDSDHLAEMSSMTTEHCQSQDLANDDCEEHHNCGACLAHCSAALLTVVSVLNTSHRFTFESDYLLWDAPSTYSRLLRPPKFI